jgi:ketosteroid isomerase-like protein
MGYTNMELLDIGLEAFNRRDASTFKALFAADAEIVPLRGELEGTVYRGADAADRFFADLEETWASLHIEVDEVRDGPGWVLAFGLLKARGASSGVDVEIHFGWVLRARDGLLTSFRVYTNREEALEAVGLRTRR